MKQSVGEMKQLVGEMKQFVGEMKQIWWGNEAKWWANEAKSDGEMPHRQSEITPTKSIGVIDQIPKEGWFSLCRHAPVNLTCQPHECMHLRGWPACIGDVDCPIRWSKKASWPKKMRKKKRGDVVDIDWTPIDMDEYLIKTVRSWPHFKYTADKFYRESGLHYYLLYLFKQAI